MSDNRVVIYSNGIADFQRCYQVEANVPKRISIPVRQDHLADVLASFNVFGNVKLASPPTFRPSNESEGNISIDPERVMEDLATRLSGARIHIQRAGGAIEGTLVGLHQEEEATIGEPIQPKSIIVLADDGVRRCLLREIHSLMFLDEDVQAEISKALQRNYQRIKPNSTFVDLELSAAQKDAEAVVQYTIPAAAWKISYRLRMVEGRETQLQGFAIVDNNTDEDWTDFQVCVVTGEPITFSTDLADSKSPRRKHVNLVSEMALGAVDVEAPMMLADLSGAAAEVDILHSVDMCEAPLRKGVSRAAMQLQTAETETAEIREVGDFSLFESESPVTIPAKRSAAIPVFNVSIAHAKSVLHYKHENHPDRPYRSIDFMNQAEFSLGRGVCTVYEEGAYAGNCVIPPLKPGERRLLPHALETGVSVQYDPRRLRKNMVALRLSQGVCYTTTRQRHETHYHIISSRDQQFELVLDHKYVESEPDIEARIVREGQTENLDIASRLSDGVRYSIPIGAKCGFVVKVVERRVTHSQMELIKISKQQERYEIAWLENNLVRTNGPLAQEPGVLECLRIQKDLDDNAQEISDIVRKSERLAERQERLRQNIKAGGQDELTARWRTELDQAEQAIRTIEEEQIPALRDVEKRLQSMLKDALTSLAAEWTDEGGE